MHLKRVLPLAAALTCGLLLLVGCGENTPPVLGDIVADPADPVPPGGKVILTVSATDEDGDAITFSWTAVAGELDPSTGDTVTWTAPADLGKTTITVTADDGNGGTDEKSIELETRNWLRADMAAYTPDTTVPLQNPGTTEIEFELEEGEVIPPGALVDSAFFSADFDGEDTLEYHDFNAYVVSPTGTEVEFYNGVGLIELNVDEFRLAAVADEAAEGTWKVKVVIPQAGPPGGIDECELELYIRY